MIKATVNQSIYEVKEGTTLSDLAKQVQLPQEPIILLAYMDGKLRELFTPMTKDCHVRFVTLKEQPSHFSGCIGLSHDDPPLFLSQTAWSRRASDATWSTSSSYGIPTARAAIGTRECGVMPGFVLISRR